MESSGVTILNCLKLRFLILLHVLTWGFSQEVTSSWTFNISRASFISFSPRYTNKQNQHISLGFRTRNPNGLLFCHYLKDLDVKELQRINYRMCAEIRYGLFVLNYKIKIYEEDEITIGRALNNDQWHLLDIFINSTSGELKVRLDTENRVISLKSYSRENFISLLDWTDQASVIYFGGMDPDTSFSDYISTHFIGCMQDIRYENQDGRFLPVPVEMVKGVVNGCLDACTTSPCHHGGQCVNYYYRAVCDCFGTDYQGDVCSDLGPATVTLRGYEWLMYSLHNLDKNVLTEKLRLSLEFKTSRGSGVLFYADGGSPYHSHVTASVHAGQVYVSVAFGDKDIDFQEGISVDDYRWHNLTIVHDIRKVYLYLDGREHFRNITNDKFHLSLDPKLFIGGGDNFAITRGLPVTQNFVGCIKNLYINEVSILYQMLKNDSRVKYNGGGSIMPHYTCEEVVNIPISFQKSGTMLLLNSTEEMKSSLNVEFDFKTVRSEALLLYVKLTDTDTSMEYNFGYIEVWIHLGQPWLKFAASGVHLDRTQNLSIPNMVNNNIWHSLHLSFNNGQAKLKVDGNSIATALTRRTLEITNPLAIGWGFNKYKESEGFVGCIRNLKVQGVPMDALNLAQTKTASGLIIDGCNIIDYCHTAKICEHGGICLSNWNGIACDCMETHYVGRTCQFPKYKRTCDDYYQSGINETGVMLIDLDGPGPLDPVHVQCIMGFEEQLEFYGKTIVDHNLIENTTVRGTMMTDLKKILSYREFNKSHLLQLTAESAWCQQYIRYDCIHSPIRLGTGTWFTAASGAMVEYLGTEDQSRAGFCACSMTNSCAGDQCNCDNKTMDLQQDAGYNSVISQLPILEVTIKQDGNPLDPGSANLTLGPLICWGSKNQLPSAAVTFASGNGYLQNVPWRSSDIRIGFRTHHDRAILLYQTGTQNIHYFFVAIMDNMTLKVLFRWGLKQALEVDLRSPVPVNDGWWHQVSVEMDRFNVRCVLDMTEKIVPIPSDVPTLTPFTGVLFIGGVNSSVMKNQLVAAFPGVIGCMRGLYYNHRSFDLSELIDPSTTDVYQHCMTSCWPNPCENGAQCIEQWGKHRCDCLNTWTQSGYNCETDINKDSVTFLGGAASYLYFREPFQSHLLDSSIIFSFRTLLKNELLLYIHDHFNNFVQVELQEGNKIVAKFNRFNMILSQTKSVPGQLYDGNWNQVVVDNADGYIKVIVNVDDEPARNSYKKLSLTTYLQNPFHHEEIVKPLRPAAMPEPGVHVYVGGVPSNMSRYPTLNGCIRGLKIGDQVFELQKAASQTSSVSPLCTEGCELSPCKNGGSCLEMWQNQQFKCDCSSSEYAGPNCTTESSGYFQGQSILMYEYDPPKEATETRTERLELVFRVGSSAHKNMILIFIYSQRYITHDFLIVYLDPDHGVYLNLFQGQYIYGVGKEGRFADGQPHQLLYRRDKSEMILTLDEEGIGRVTVPDNALDELDTIMIGGILDGQFQQIPNPADYRKYLNFSGCISEVTFYPISNHPFALRPLKDLRDNQTTAGTATVFGPEIVGCHTHDIMATKVSSTTRPTPTARINAKLTFPPWNPGPAKTMFIGKPPKLNTVITSTTTLIIPSSSNSEENNVLKTQDKEKHQDKIVAVTVSVVSFLLIVTIIVAVILIRMCRQEKKKKQDIKEKQEMMVKLPLNESESADITDRYQKKDYIAKLDEFSMVSLTLGARPVKTDAMPVLKPPASDASFSYSSVPQSDDDAHACAEQKYYSCKKNRPASSISEVLEEMERQKSTRYLELNLMEDETALVESSMPSSHHHADDDLDNDADNESDSPPLPSPPHVVHEYNGDSGYEAESKPDEDETLMNDSDHGGGSCHGDDTYHSNSSYHGNALPLQHSYNESIFPTSPESKNSNYVSDSTSPELNSDGNSLSGEVSPLTTPTASSDINNGFPNSLVNDNGAVQFQKKPTVSQGGVNT